MREPEGIRPHAARPQLHELRGPRGALRLAAERVGRADRLVGRRPRRARADLTHRTRRTTTSSRTGCRTSCRRPASRSTSRIACTGKARASLSSRPERGSRSRAWAEAIASSPTTSSSSWSTSPARRSRRYRRARPIKAVVSAPANGEILETNAYHVEATGAWRMMVLVKQLDATQPVELRGYLQNGEDVLTETWSNLVPPR